MSKNKTDANAKAAQPPPAATPPTPAGSNWTRPKPVAHDNNLQSWMLLLATLCVLVALWIPMRALYQRHRFRPPAPEGARDAETFFSLAYMNITDSDYAGPDEVTRTQFESHVKALRAHGFNPIGLDDVREFYFEGKLLPRKAVLMTFEQSRKGSYTETRDVMRGNRWRAVMFARADWMREGEPSALRWPILREMGLSGLWDIAAESDMGFKPIPAGPDGETGNFFSSPMWISTESRFEHPEEFMNRIKAEHERFIAEFKSNIGAPPKAFAFPFGDYGQFDPRAEMTRMVNLAEVGRHYGLGFTLGPFGLNTKHSDPRRLNRLLVQSNWGPGQLIDALNTAFTRKPWEMSEIIDDKKWTATWGETIINETNFVLRATPHPTTPFVQVTNMYGEVFTNRAPSATSGASSWLLGSDLFEDFSIQVKFRVDVGEFGIMLRASPGGEERVQFRINDVGTCWLTQKVPGAEEFVLATIQAGPRRSEIREVNIYLKGRHCFVTLDGRMLFSDPVFLHGTPRPGKVGLQIWDRTPGAAKVEIFDMIFPRTHEFLMTWNAEVGRHPAYLMHWLNTHSYQIAIASPPWLDVVRNIPLIIPKWDDQTIQTMASVYNIPVLPRIRLRSVELAQRLAPEVLIEEIERIQASGLYIDCSSTLQEEVSALMGWLKNLSEMMEKKDMKLAIRFPASVEKLASFASIAAMLPSALIAVEHGVTADVLEQSTENVVRVENVPGPSAADLHLDLYYQISTLAVPDEDMSPEAHMEKLRSEGSTHYAVGEYAEAIKLWSQWWEEDPVSSEAPALIGDAYLRLDNKEKALEYYQKSLQISPGQISLVARITNLLMDMDRKEEARDLLNLYARIFPENPDILIAQANWLNRTKRRTEARNMVQTLVNENPLNMEARVALQSLLDRPGERYKNLREILTAGHATSTQAAFGQSLLNMEMITLPEASVFFEHVRDQANNGPSAAVRDLYESFLPRTNAITDDFASGKLSDAWLTSTGLRTLDRGRYTLRAGSDQAEAYLRLRKSEWMRDGYLEVTLDESLGFFWAYARRNARGQVRFGFDQDGYIHIQTWQGGSESAVTHDRRPWIRPPGVLRVRLEIRGDGARGFVNGTEVFRAPITIPSDVAYGWWGVAPFSSEAGLARANILRLDCEPLAPVLALLPPGAHPNQQVEHIRPFVGEISALAPVWGKQNPDGSIHGDLPDGAEIIRMFCLYHCIRLLPVVDLSYESEPNVAHIMKFIKDNTLQGVILKRPVPPSKVWMTEMARALEDYPATVILMQSDSSLWHPAVTDEELEDGLVVRPDVLDIPPPEGGFAVELTELPVGSVLFPPLKQTWRVPVLDPDTTLTEEDLEAIAPRVYLFDTKGRTALSIDE